jgi:hypothetical protein
MRAFRMLALGMGRLLLASVCTSPVPAIAQTPVARSSIVRGRVIDDQSGAPLGSVVIDASRGSDTLARVVTDEEGYFRTAVVADGDLVLTFRRLGYQAGKLSVDALARQRPIEVAMTAVARRLDEIAVASEQLPERRSARRDFDARAQRKMGGTYIRRSDLDKLQAARLSDVMRRVPGARIVDSSGVLLVASSRGYKVDMKRGDAMTPCVMHIGVDGQIKEPGYSINTIDPLQIYGIEVYASPATIPVEFGGMRTDSFCGLVLIWTRIE